VFIVGVNGPVRSARVAVCQPAICELVKAIAGRSAATYVFSCEAGDGLALCMRAGLAVVTWEAVPHAFSRHVAAIPKTKAARRMATLAFVT
jgi:hypothetical protein